MGGIRVLKNIRKDTVQALVTSILGEDALEMHLEGGAEITDHTGNGPGNFIRTHRSTEHLTDDINDVVHVRSKGVHGVDVSGSTLKHAREATKDRGVQLMDLIQFILIICINFNSRSLGEDGNDGLKVLSERSRVASSNVTQAGENSASDLTLKVRLCEVLVEKGH